MRPAHSISILFPRNAFANGPAAKAIVVALALLIPALAPAGNSPTRIKIASVPDVYMPANLTIRERVSMQNFHFEVNPETLRARLVIEYTYPDKLLYGRNDDKGGPKPSIVQIPGLQYKPETHAVVFEADGRQTVCGQVGEHRGIFGRRLVVKATGACFVSWKDTKRVENDGWAIHRSRAIDTYLVVR
jgi:hypothetical protein